MRLVIAILLAAGLLAAPAAAESKVELNGENTKIEFVGSKPEGKHEGGFKKLSGTATLGTAEPTGMKVEVEIETDSLYSDNDKLTAHLKSPDFFGVKANPTAKFVSSGIARSDKGDDVYTVTGDLTLCGKTKTISFPARIAVGDSVRLAAAFKIDRTDFGMTYGKGKVDDEVTVKVTVSARK